MVAVVTVLHAVSVSLDLKLWLTMADMLRPLWSPCGTGSCRQLPSHLQIRSKVIHV
jgi:hypothetical protein